MSWLVNVSGPADRQIERIDIWWRKNRPKAPDLFTQQIGWAIGFLSERRARGEIETTGCVEIGAVELYVAKHREDLCGPHVAGT